MSPRRARPAGSARPAVAQPYVAGGARPVAWAGARRLLATADTYWLATVRPEGRPHLVPVLAVGVDGALHFVAGPTTRKGRNLARDPRCVIAARGGSLDLVVEGEAARVTQGARLRRVAAAYGAKYRWPVAVRDGALYGEGAPTAGPAPYDVYEIVPTVAFGFPTEGVLAPARWRFPRGRQRVALWRRTMGVATRSVPHDRPDADRTTDRLPDAVRTLFDGPNYAHVATTLPDGAPHSVPVWVGVEGEQIAFLTGPDSRKAHNLERDPRVAISIVAHDRPFAMAYVRGRVVARLEGAAALGVMDRIAYKYTGQSYPLRTGRVVFLVSPERAWARTYG
ncbi:MAG: TIGR03618 family F420-dependent PPOX class oxidoreductase [Armatimonadota bacterium]|nr:TIGR03618 family F420-dependent PPOX class oxidoreductase [Armatimonadota bacterium]